MTGGGTQSGSRQRTDDVELQAVEGVGSLIARPTGTRPEHGDRCAIRNALTLSQRHLTVAKGPAKTRALDVERAHVPSLLHITEAAGRLQLLHKLRWFRASQDARRLPQAADITPPHTLPLCSPRPKPQPRILPVQRTSLHPGPGSQLSHVRPAYWATIYLLQHRKAGSPTPAPAAVDAYDGVDTAGEPSARAPARFCSSSPAPAAPPSPTSPAPIARGLHHLSASYIRQARRAGRRNPSRPSPYTRPRLPSRTTSGSSIVHGILSTICNPQQPRCSYLRPARRTRPTLVSSEASAQLIRGHAL